jgi:hypothetical protein
MKRFTKVLFTIGSAALCFATTAQAQVTSNSEAGIATPVAGVDITLTGTIQSALVLTVSGTASNLLTGPGAAVDMPVRAAGTFEFGTFNTAQQTPLANGRLVRAGTGAFAVASLVARVAITGSTNNASVLMSTVADASGGGSPIAAGNVRFARPGLAWDAAGMGTNLAFGAAGVEFCPASGCLNATDYVHDLALYIPDTQAAGSFTQVISYDASIL